MDRRLLLDRLAAIRLVVFDFDGVLTDNGVYMFEDGREAVRCFRGDGIGLQRLQAAGIGAAILSTETSPVVSARARKLGVRCLQGCPDKRAALEALLAELKLPAERVAFVGNDVNDGACLALVGMPIIVQDAHPAVRPLACYRTAARGGEGAVREVCDLFAEALAPRAAARSKRMSRHLTVAS